MLINSLVHTVDTILRLFDLLKMVCQWLSDKMGLLLSLCKRNHKLKKQWKKVRMFSFNLGHFYHLS